MATISEALNVAIEHHQAGRLQAAEQIYRQILAADPNQAVAWNLLGLIAHQAGKHGIAIEHIQRAIALDSSLADFHYNLGNVFRVQGKLDNAVACYRRALELNPASVETCNNLAVALKAHRNLDEAVACHRRALELKPDCMATYVNLANVLTDQGKMDQAITCFRRALGLKPDFPELHSNLLFTLNYCTGLTLEGFAAEHAAYERRHAAPLRGAIQQPANDRDPERRLRLGFVSPNLLRHPVGYFLAPVFENLSPEQHEVFCYSNSPVKDDLTDRLRTATTHWRDVVGIDDQRLAEQIRADRIDILFDMAGHTVRNRLLVFARHPAPIQVSWAGYSGTTGLTAIDYLLADRYVIPFGAERHYQERALRMPDGYICYDAPAYAPPPTPLPALQRGYVTFGCFNNPPKITSQVFEVWARILHRLPHSRLVLKYFGLNDPAVARRFTEMCGAHGIDPNRLELFGQSPHPELMAAYNGIDLALDSFPYAGCLTTCEALWMGVPVITCPMETFASRHGLSHLSNIGLTETIARNFDDYVELAVAWASDLPRLAAVRSGLRERMAASPLCNGPRFAANLAHILRDIWREWCRSQPVGANSPSF